MPFILRKTITETFLERVKATPNQIGYQYHPRRGATSPGRYTRQITFRQFHGECSEIAFGLMAAGVGPGDRIALLSSTRYRWSVCDMGILGARAVTVPIYPSSTPAEVRWILKHSGAKVVFVEDSLQLEKISAALSNPESADELAKSLKQVVVLDAVPSGVPPQVIAYDELRRLGSQEQARHPDRFNENLAALQPEDPLTVCYTSGTTGVPKGVVLTHDNLMSILEDCMHVLGHHYQADGEVTLSFLPFSHIMGKVESLAGHVFGWRQCFSRGLELLLEDFQEARPTLIFSVPRVFEKAEERIQNIVEHGPAWQKHAYKQALKLGYTVEGKRWNGERPGIAESLAFETARKLVFKPVLDRFGGRLRYVICGGAPLSKELGERFAIYGLKILEGYGLTETCAPVTLNTPEEQRFGTVGKPLPEVAIRIAADGEILVKSRKVFKEYFQDPVSTKEALDSAGWFHTGDVGEIDEDGYLRVTDRKKDLIITSGGKNVAPQKLEQKATMHMWIRHLVVHGDKRPYLTALIVLNREVVSQYAQEQEILFSEYAQLTQHPKIISKVQKIVDEINSELASFETIKKFVILPQEFSVETGELTPSLKVKRRYVEAQFASLLDPLYSEPRT